MVKYTTHRIYHPDIGWRVQFRGTLAAHSPPSIPRTVNLAKWKLWARYTPTPRCSVSQPRYAPSPVSVTVMTLGTSCEHTSCCHQVTPLSNMALRSVHVVAGARASFLFMAEQCSVAWMDHIGLSGLPWRQLSCFHFVFITNEFAINTSVQSVYGHWF